MRSARAFDSAVGFGRRTHATISQLPRPGDALASDLMPPLVDRVGLPPEELTRLGGELDALHMLGDVVRWAARQRPPRSIADVVTQDEYTHDVILAYQGDLHLVFDTT